MKDDVLSGMMLFFSVILLVGGGVLLADWRTTRGIVGAGALVHALATGLLGPALPLRGDLAPEHRHPY